MRPRTFLASLAAVAAFVAALVLPAPAQANPAPDGYSSQRCDASGGNLVVTNYYITVSGSRWQRYHVDADRAGGTGTAPKVYVRDTGTSTWRDTYHWNDFYVDQSNEARYSDWKVVFANGTACALGAV